MSLKQYFYFGSRKIGFEKGRETSLVVLSKKDEETKVFIRLGSLSRTLQLLKE